MIAPMVGTVWRRFASTLVVGVAGATVMAGCGSDSDDSARESASDTSRAAAESADVAAYRETVPTRFVTDDAGRVVLLRGTNEDGSVKNSGHMTQMAESELARIPNEFGWNSVRVLLQWSAIEPEKGEFDEAYLDEVVTDLDRWRDLGVHVILDMHQDIYGSAVHGNGAPEWATITDGLTVGDPPEGQWYLAATDPAAQVAYQNFWDKSRGHPELQEHYWLAWQEVVERVKDHPALLGYDLMNEPVFANGDLTATLKIQPDAAAGRFTNPKLTSFMQDGINAIRELDTEHWITLAPTSLLNAFPYKGDLIASDIRDPRDGQPRLIYGPHLYQREIHDGLPRPAGDQYVVKWEEFRTAEAESLKAALWIGEFGGPRIPDFPAYLDEVLTMADRSYAGWAHWVYDSGGWGPRNDDLTVSETGKQLVRAYPSALAGVPTSYSFDPTTKVMKVTYTTAELAAPTELSLPTLLYPKAPQVVAADNVELDVTWIRDGLASVEPNVETGTTVTLCVVPAGEPVECAA